MLITEHLGSGKYLKSLNHIIQEFFKKHLFIIRKNGKQISNRGFLKYFGVYNDIICNIKEWHRFMFAME